MNNLKDNLKDWITDIIGGVMIIATIAGYAFDYIDLWPKACVLFAVGVAFFFIPDDILSQMAQKFINKKIDEHKKSDNEQ